MKRPRLAAALAAAVLVPFLLLYAPRLDRPALLGDEAQDPVAGLQLVQGRVPVPPVFLWHALLQGSPYRGGLNTLVHAAALLVWEPSPFVLRGVNLAVGGLALLLILALGSALAGPAAGLWACWLLIADPNLFVGIRHDHNGLGLALALGAASALCWLRWWRGGERRWGAAGAFCAGLMVWNHALSSAAAAAMALAATGVGGGELRRRLASRPRDLRLFAGWALAGAGPFLWFAAWDGFSVLALAADPAFNQEAGTRWGLGVLAKNWRLLLATLDGDYARAFLLDGLAPRRSSLFAPAALGAGLAWALARAKPAGTAWLGSTALAGAALFHLVAGAYGAHHVLLVLYPWLHLALAAGLFALPLPRRLERRRTPLASAACALLLAASLPATLELRREAFADRVHPGFSRQVQDDLLACLRAEGGRAVVMDWAFTRSLDYASAGSLAMAQRDRFLPISGAVPRPRALGALGVELSRPDNIFVVSEEPRYAAASRRLFALAGRLGREPALVRTIRWEAGDRDYLKVYRFPPRARRMVSSPHVPGAGHGPLADLPSRQSGPDRGQRRRVPL